MTPRLVAALAAVVIFAAAGRATAQATLVPPDEIAIYVHKDMKNTDFVEGLVCELGRVLVAPVRATTIDLPLTSDYLATPSQLWADMVGNLFDRSTQRGSEREFRYLILPYDLKVEGLHYVFAQSFIDSRHVAVMSTIRLMPTDPVMPRKKISDATVERLYKLMLKSVALFSGLETQGGIMAFPRSLPELDAKSAEFCSQDRSALVQAGVLKDKPFGACSTIAMAGP